MTAAAEHAYDSPPDLDDPPLGFNLDGRPKTSRRGRPRTRSAGTSGPKTTPGPRAPTGGPKSPRARPAASGGAKGRKTKADGYEEGLNGILQLICVPLIGAGAWADVAAVSLHGPALSKAIAQTADHDERLAAILDKALQVGPYGLVLTALMSLGAQIGVNHGAIPGEAARFFGALPTEVLMNVFRQQQAAQAAADEGSPENRAQWAATAAAAGL